VTHFLQTGFLVIYFSALALIFVYGIHRYFLLYLYYKHRKTPKVIPKRSPAYKPRVTVQLPIYNEKYVVSSLMEAVGKLDYPKDKLEIQVLDDSTDETKAIARSYVDKLKALGIDVLYIHRHDRKGFKAGALNEGLEQAKGDLIAIFDADFCPPPDFLARVVSYFSDERIGMVQTRWGYLNQTYSMLTNLQSFFLDGHFLIEHFARNRSGRFFNFNGTAGIWRRECLTDAGGWQADTLTEDLDLSYRAQLKGWKFLFIPEVVAPCEIPVEMNAFKSQQFRWAKGSIQTAKKMFWPIMKSPYPMKVKLEAMFHLTNNVAYFLMAIISLSIYPAMIVRFNMGLEKTVIIDFLVLLGSTASVSLFYATAQKGLYANWFSRSLHLPLLMSLGIGITLNNARAVVEALFNIKTEFKRTPKYGVKTAGDTWKGKKYKGELSFVVILEILMGLYCTFNIYFALTNKAYLYIPFLLLFQSGFFYVAFMSFFQQKGCFKRRKPVFELMNYRE